MTPTTAVCQQRERPVMCWCGRTTWRLSGLCAHHDDQDPVNGRFTNGYVRRVAGCTYRQLDYWCRSGYLGDDKATGSGHDRRFTPDELRLATLLARISNRLPNASLTDIAPALHAWCTTSDVDPGEHAVAIVHGFVVSLDDAPDLGDLALVLTVPALLSEVPAASDGDQRPAAAGSPSPHTGSAAGVGLDLPASNPGTAGHDHAPPPLAGRSTGTPTGGAVVGTTP